MMIAIGAPGELPRLWLETASPAIVAANIEQGEVATSDVRIGADGRPLPDPLPAISNVLFGARA